MTMVDIAGQLGYTHPSMVVLLQKMKTRGYVNSEKDSLDSRKQNLSLTQKAMDLLPELEQIWTCCEQAIYSMLEGDFSITEQLDKIEESLDSVSIDQRFYNEFQKHKKS